MSRPDTDHTFVSLPWQWFEFREPARAAGEISRTASADEPAGDAVWEVVVDGHRVPFKYFRKAGGEVRPVVLMLHGMGLTIGTFRGVAGYLFQTHDLILPDYSGFSTHEVTLPSLKTFATAVWRIADAVGVRRLSLAGNSLGGGLSLVAALLEPGRVEKMVFSNPACYPQRLPSLYRWVRVPLLGELFMAVTTPERLVGGVEHIGYVDMSRFDPVLRAQYAGSLDQLRNRLRLMRIIRLLPADGRDVSGASHLARLGEIKAPVLVTWGEQDPLLEEGTGVRLARELGNGVFDPHADLAHMPHEEAPERIGRRWAEFLNRVLTTDGHG